jgi:hypothetical protein
VNAGDQIYHASPLEGARLGVPREVVREESGVRETLGSLWAAQVLRLPTDTVAGVPASVSDIDVEH